MASELQIKANPNKNTGHRIQDTENRRQDTEYRIPPASQQPEEQSQSAGFEPELLNPIP
jgi:hypothetical protein